MIIYVNDYDVGIEALPTPTITLLLLLLLLLLDVRVFFKLGLLMNGIVYLGH